MSRLLVVRPEGDEAANELSRWAESLADAFEGSIHERHELKGNDVSRGALEAGLADSRALLFFGHGHWSGLIARSTDVVDPTNINQASGKVVIAIACSSAKELGVRAISDGTHAYLGFDEQLVWLADGKFGPAITSGIRNMITEGGNIEMCANTLRSELNEVYRYYRTKASENPKDAWSLQLLVTLRVTIRPQCYCRVALRGLG